MNRRNFFKTVTGFVAGMFTTSAIAKEKPKLTVAMVQKAKNDLEVASNIQLSLGCKEFRDALTEVEKEKLTTYHWIDMGYWSSGLKQLACCYTRPNGMRMRLAALSEDDRIEETKKATEKRTQAIEGGAWYPTNMTEYYLA